MTGFIRIHVGALVLVGFYTLIVYTMGRMHEANIPADITDLAIYIGVLWFGAMLYLAAAQGVAG